MLVLLYSAAVAALPPASGPALPPAAGGLALPQASGPALSPAGGGSALPLDAVLLYSELLTLPSPQLLVVLLLLALLYPPLLMPIYCQTKVHFFNVNKFREFV
jgi:hypothetical protein